jgi:hypothetical protein
MASSSALWGALQVVTPIRNDRAGRESRGDPEPKANPLDRALAMAQCATFMLSFHTAIRLPTSPAISLDFDHTWNGHQVKRRYRRA